MVKCLDVTYRILQLFTSFVEISGGLLFLPSWLPYLYIFFGHYLSKNIYILDIVVWMIIVVFGGAGRWPGCSRELGCGG